ncbi:uncharacterized protein LOC134822706 [Bolinopsis microptera]|uniref:uncharacterized protein LOC134822706 n=1 Tax=Bolinopsis microptera TaxID=2820187 RepID=UPI003079E963
MANKYERVGSRCNSESCASSLKLTPNPTNRHEETDETESKLSELQSNGNPADGTVTSSCVLLKLNSDKESVAFRRKRYYPLLVFITAGVMVSCLGLIFSYATGNMTVSRCFIAVGGWSVLVGVAFQFRHYFMIEQCSVIEKCLDIEKETDMEKAS